MDLQVSLPHYTDRKFLSEAVNRYQRFLQLIATYPDEFFTPCYDFDLVWHAHQVHPLAYHQDTCALLGRLLTHDDDSVSESAARKLQDGEALTKELWTLHFPDYPLWRRGCMHAHERTFVSWIRKAAQYCGKMRVEIDRVARHTCAT